MKARLDGSLVELQGFYVSDDAVLALTRHWIESSGPTLLPIERELVFYAHEKLDGDFPIRRLYDQFKGKISHRQLVKLGRRWENNGWLAAPASVVEPRTVTDKLWEIVMSSTRTRSLENESINGASTSGIGAIKQSDIEGR